MKKDGVEIVLRHYEPSDGDPDRVARVARIMSDLGTGTLTSAQLAPLDQFHVRGLAATIELANLVGPTSDMHVLDAGSGLGGPSRYLAETFGCSVIGIDLSASFVELARWLAERSGVAGRVGYEVADLRAIPFDNNGFDLVWTQHVIMNIRDRAQAYSEFRRVLKPAGRLAFYDVIAADAKPAIAYPVPWASEPGASHLLTQEETIAALEDAGFVKSVWRDVTAEALKGFVQPVPTARPRLGLASVMGPGFDAMASNLSRNLAEGRLRLAMGIFDRSVDAD